MAQVIVRKIDIFFKIDDDLILSAFAYIILVLFF